MSLKDISIRGSYTGKGKQILDDFLLPTLKESIKYNRITGYYTIESLLAISQGIETLFENNGTMRLIIGIHSIPADLIDAVSMKDALEDEIAEIRKEISKNLVSLESALDKKRIATLSWMIEDGLLEVKAAAVRGTGIFHPKTLIFEDSFGNEVVAVGSSNETGNGLGGNFEQLMVAKSWENIDVVNDQKAFFDSLWNNQLEGVYVEDISEETRTMIQTSINDVQRPDEFQFEDNIIKKMSEMPANYFVSGDIPSLYMHQERAVLDALSRWPVRVMLSDEVGLGKTFEAAAVLTFLVKYSNIGKVVILTPKSVLQQWQDELKTNFRLDTWLFDSSKKQYKSSNGKIKNMANSNPLGVNSPNIILMSAQYARGTKGNNSVFLKSDTVLPELLIVDEAHAARISTDLSGKRKKTKLYKMLESISKKVPHIVLATATPMQKEAFEYHAMLKLLGLPKIWEKEDNYDLSLRIISSMDKPDPSDSANAGGLLYMTLSKMKPSLESLTAEEKSLANNILNNFRSLDGFGRGELVRNNWSCFKNLFIKLHPAKLLTVRNTRKSLLNVGYKFPERNLNAVNLYNSDEIELFYEKVNDYLTRECFSIEKALYPDRRINIGFIRVSYQQRVASSLYSCRESLNRRLLRARNMYNQLINGDSITINGNSFDISKEFDDLDDDELLLSGETIVDDDAQPTINKKELLRAISIEQAALGSLVNQVDQLLSTVGDKKIDKSLDLAFEKLSEDDSVLLFSRYTDTIDALISRFKLRNDGYTYAIYTGDRSLIIENGEEILADKNEIKKSLFEKKVRIVFCSDAASEGLNLQAARVLINVDVPWTPARLEQRIGRVARLGQVADEVDIFNVWYPHSIEAKMYGRIQRRLHDTNLAIGEFPEVVAAGIRWAVLNNDANDSSLDELRNIRNSYQTKALELLWVDRSSKITASEKVRNDLMELCKNKFNYKEISATEGIFEFNIFNQNSVELSNQPGKAESINLKSLPFSLFDIKMKNVLLNNDIKEKISYISTLNGEPILFENVLDIAITGRDVCFNDLINGWPKTLIRPKSLTLDYAIECNIDESPLFWK